MMMSLMHWWHSHLPILPILIPGLTAFILILIGSQGPDDPQHDRRQPWRRLISQWSAGIGLLNGLALLYVASQDQLLTYLLGEWSAPFGIVLVVDRLAAMMLLLSYVLCMPLIWFASSWWDSQGRYFHALVHFLLMGMCGAFVTTDLFNLFVFFEILLMASYILLQHQHTQARFALGFHYVSLNLLGSLLFLIGLGLIYGSVGSLNMADVARLYPNLPADQHQLAQVGAVLLLMVFGLKAAILPVGFWLPKSYAVAAAPVAAVFALMTKVGIYALLRVQGTVFADADSQQLWQIILLVSGVLGSIYGALGALSAQRIGRFVGFMVLSSLGTLLMGLALMTPVAWAGMLYYLVHSTLVAGALYLLSDWISRERGQLMDHLKVGSVMTRQRQIAAMFFVLALMMAGLPPFSGFIGKLLLLQAAVQLGHGSWLIFPTVIIVGFISIFAFIRVGLIIFWRAHPVASTDPHLHLTDQQHDQTLARLPWALGGLVILLIGYAVAANPVYHYMLATAQQLQQPLRYQDALLKRDASGRVISVQPFDSHYVPRSGSADDPYRDTIPHVISPATLQGNHLQPYHETKPSDPEPSHESQWHP